MISPLAIPDTPPRGETVPGGEDLLHDMPTAVREDVSMEEYASLLSRAHFFQHVDASFLRRLSTATSTFLFAPGDIVLYSGDMGREMYFIARGYVEVCPRLTVWEKSGKKYTSG